MRDSLGSVHHIQNREIEYLTIMSTDREGSGKMGQWLRTVVALTDNPRT